MSLEFFIDIKSFRSHYDPGFDSASNRNEYEGYIPAGKGGRWVGLTALPFLRADRPKILGSSNFWSPKSLSKAYLSVNKLEICTWYIHVIDVKVSTTRG